MRTQAPDSNSKVMSRHHRSFPQTKNGRRLSKMILDSVPSKIIHPHEASLGEETRTSFKTKGSTLEAGDPRSKMKSTHGSLGLSFRSLFLTSIVGHYITNPVNPEIDLTVDI